MIVLGISVALAMALTSSIIGPIRKVTAAAQELTKGNVDVQIPDVKSNDEIQDLAEGFQGLLAAFRQMLETAPQGKE